MDAVNAELNALLAQRQKSFQSLIFAAPELLSERAREYHMAGDAIVNWCIVHASEIRLAPQPDTALVIPAQLRDEFEYEPGVYGACTTNDAAGQDGD